MDLDADMYDDNAGVTQTESDAIVTEGDALRDNALHLRGVDDMSTADVHTYLNLYSTDSKPRIEWIDDTSLNLVYYSADDARIALAHLTTVPTDQIGTKESSAAQNNPKKPDSKLAIRYATESDKKVKGAKDRSRWYLFHPEDDPDSRPRHRGKARREEPYSINGRHERRIASKTPGSADLFADRLIKARDDPILVDRSSTPKADLFEERQKPVKSGEDLFAERILEASKSSQRAIKSDSRTSLPPTDLFARIHPEPPTRSLAERISNATSKELFPERHSGSANGDLASRISGGPVMSTGIHVRCRAKASDLY